jgi:hypothetical protein
MPICPGKIVVFQICNSNADPDDNYSVVLNGVTLGDVILDQNDYVGGIFYGSQNTEIYLSDTNKDFACPIPLMVRNFFDDSILIVGNNTLELKFVKVGDGFTFGTIGLRTYDIDSYNNLSILQ